MHERIARNLALTYLNRLEKKGERAADEWANRTLTSDDTPQVTEEVRKIRQAQDDSA